LQNLPVIYESTPSLARSKNDTHIILALARIKILFIIYHTSDVPLLPKKGGGEGRESQEFPSAAVWHIHRGADKSLA
jgi:hypothetical protein